MLKKGDKIFCIKTLEVTMQVKFTYKFFTEKIFKEKQTYYIESISDFLVNVTSNNGFHYTFNLSEEGFGFDKNWLFYDYFIDIKQLRKEKIKKLNVLQG